MGKYGFFSEEEVNPKYREWDGMPEFIQEDEMAYRTIKVHFRNKEDIKHFEEVIGQKIPRKFPSIWFPKEERKDLTKKVCVDSDES